jgi:hypothetical protein
MAVNKIAAIFYMGTIRGLYNRLQTVDPDKIARETMEGTEEEIRQYNLQQLIDGKTNEGIDISPTYFEDPFFKTPEQAQAYSDWKDRISPPSNRRKGVPNLYINGYYHGTRKVEIQGDKIIYSSTYSEANDIEQTFKNIDGLNPESRKKFIPFVLRPVFNHLIQEATGLKMK